MSAFLINNDCNAYEKYCCFTGYRPGKFPFELNKKDPRFNAFENRLIETVFSLPDEECYTFYTGMAMGFDIIAAETVLLLKKSDFGFNIRLICVLPFANQADGFPEPWRSRYFEIIKHADEVITLSDRYFSGCYFRRNRFMIDNSDYVVTWFDGRRGGTENTLKYAEKKGRHIINLNTDFDEYDGGFQISLDINDYS